MQLTEAQKQLATAHTGAVIVHARAGSGKTTGLIHNLIDKYSRLGMNPKNIMVSSFSRESARSIKDKLYTIFGPIIHTAHIGTSHSICHKILSAYKVLPENKFKAWQGRQAVFEVIPPRFLMGGKEKVYLNLISAMKNRAAFYENLAPGFLQNWENEKPFITELGIDVELAEQVWRNYEKKKAQLNAWDYDDLPFMTYQMLMNREDIRTAVQSYFTHVLVDEYQDTNYLQYLLYKLIAAPHNNIVVIGDEYQSIYGFRGSTPDYMYRFHEDYPNAQRIEFLENFRSVPSIIKSANLLLAEHEDGLLSNHEALPTRVGDEVVPVVCFMADKQQEAQIIADNIKNSDTGFKEIAILTRYNDQQCRIEEALMKAKIPYEKTDDNDYFNRPEIQAALRYLEWVEMDWEDNWVDLARDVAWKPVQCSKIDFDLWTSKNGIKTTASGKALIDKIRLVKAAVKSNNNSASVALHEIIYEDINLLKYAKEFRFGVNDGEAESNLEGLLDFAKGRTVKELLDTIERIEYTRRQTKNESEKVTLSTVHRAKGLEWEEVYIAGFQNGIFPAKQSSGSAEERRIAYVAITRAKDNLIISAEADEMVSPYLINIQDSVQFVSAAPRAMLHESITKNLKLPEDIGVEAQELADEALDDSFQDQKENQYGIYDNGGYAERME